MEGRRQTGLRINYLPTQHRLRGRALLWRGFRWPGAKRPPEQTTGKQEKNRGPAWRRIAKRRPEKNQKKARRTREGRFPE